MKQPLSHMSAGLLMAGSMLIGPNAWAQTNPPAGNPATPDRQARAWAATCAACHGTTGQSTTGIPPIGGNPDAIYRALLEFKNNQRPAATVMHQHAKGYTDDELRRIAAVFATKR